MIVNQQTSYVITAITFSINISTLELSVQTLERISLDARRIASSLFRAEDITTMGGRNELLEIYW